MLRYQRATAQRPQSCYGWRTRDLGPQDRKGAQRWATSTPSSFRNMLARYWRHTAKEIHRHLLPQGNDKGHMQTRAYFLLLFSGSIMSDSLGPHGLQHSRFLALHHLPEFAQTHAHWVDDAIQPSHPLSPPSPPALNLSQHQGLFQRVGSSCLPKTTNLL